MAYSADYYQKNKDKWRKHSREARTRRRASWEPLLSIPRWNHCSCGKYRGECKIDLHHIDPDTKVFEIITAMFNREFPDPIILLEMEKCEPLCVSCHGKKQGKR